MIRIGNGKRKRLIDNNDDFPEEIIHDILSRVPAKSLYQNCRFVSKYWFNLIKDPYFVKLHHSRINKHGSSYLITLCQEEFFNLVDNNENNNLISFKAFKIHLELPCLSESQAIILVGSANGLMCFSILPHHNLFYICNPVTKEILQLPKPPDIGPYSENSNLQYDYPASSGFGFHAQTNTYMVVRIWYFRVKGSEGLPQTGIEIYNFGSGVWRWIDQIVISKCLSNFNVPLIFLNEAFHWLIEDFKDKGSYIGVLDIGDETFKTFEKPVMENGVTDRILCSLRHSLCLIDHKYDHHIVVWTMKQYGVVRSWTKEHIIRKEIFRSFQTKLFCASHTMKNGIVFVDYDGGYQGYYDFEDEEIKQILIDGIHFSPMKLQMVLHVGSLISPRSIITCTTHQVPSAKPIRPIRFKLKKNVKKPTYFLSSLDNKSLCD